MRYYIAGLGNPGKKYEHTRHNAGRIIVDMLAVKWNFFSWEKKFLTRAFITDGEVKSNPVQLIMPDNFMNNSGGIVKKFVKGKRAAERLIVIYDDIDLPLGRFKISVGRGDGGHNGIKSIIKSLNTKDFIRIRVGVSRIAEDGVQAKKPDGGEKVLKHVLGDFQEEEMQELERVTENIGRAIETIISEGVANAMNEYNQK